MGKKVSNLNLPEGVKFPDPPPPPPNRIFSDYSWFGSYETKESIRAREDYLKYMEGWRDGFESGLASRKE